MTVFLSNFFNLHIQRYILRKNKQYCWEILKDFISAELVEVSFCNSDTHIKRVCGVPYLIFFLLAKQ